MTLYYYGIDNNLGGLENYAKSLLPHIFSSGIQVTIISCYEDYAYRDYFESLGIKSIIVPNYRKHPHKYYKSLLSILKNNNDVIIQLNVMSYRNALLFKAVKKSGIKSLVVGHSNELTGGFFSHFLHKINKNRFHKLGKKVAVTKDVISYMYKKNDEVTIINNSIDIDTYRYNEIYRDEIRHKYHLEDIKVIGQFGRISYQKNQEFSIKLIDALVKKDPSFRLLLIGKNQDDKVMDLIKNNRNNIYIDETTELYKYYSSLDLFILPSKYEGFGLVIYEALANGLDVLISDNVPYPERISNNVHQLPLDVNIWVKEILHHKKVRSITPVDGIDKYDSVSMAKHYLDVYESINQ